MTKDEILVWMEAKIAFLFIPLSSHFSLRVKCLFTPSTNTATYLMDTRIEKKREMVY